MCQSPNRLQTGFHKDIEEHHFLRLPLGCLLSKTGGAPFVLIISQPVWVCHLSLPDESFWTDIWIIHVLHSIDTNSHRFAQSAYGKPDFVLDRAAETRCNYHARRLQKKYSGSCSSHAGYLYNNLYPFPLWRFHVHSHPTRVIKAKGDAHSRKYLLFPCWLKCFHRQGRHRSVSYRSFQHQVG